MKIKDDMVKDAKRFLESARKKCAGKNIVFEHKMITGTDPGYDIVKFSEKNKFDMIVIGARGQNPLKKLFLGSVSNYIVNKSETSVLVVK